MFANTFRCSLVQNMLLGLLDHNTCCIIFWKEHAEISEKELTHTTDSKWQKKKAPDGKICTFNFWLSLYFAVGKNCSQVCIQKAPNVRMQTSEATMSAHLPCTRVRVAHRRGGIVWQLQCSPTQFPLMIKSTRSEELMSECEKLKWNGEVASDQSPEHMSPLWTTRMFEQNSAE